MIDCLADAKNAFKGKLEDSEVSKIYDALNKV